jgi:hypothetical protein
MLAIQALLRFDFRFDKTFFFTREMSRVSAKKEGRICGG